MINNKTVKLLLLISQLGIGGLELQVLELVKGLDKNRFKIFLCPIWPVMDLESEFIRAGACLVKIHKATRYDFTFLYRLIKFLKNEKIDIVHTWIFTANTWGRIAGLLAKTPVIISSERSVAIHKNKVQIIIDRILANYSEKILVNSVAVKQTLTNIEKIQQSKCEVIYNGVDYQRYENNNSSKTVIREELGLPLGNFIIGTVANCTPAKDYPNFLHAAKIVCDKLPRATFVICGGGPLINTVKNISDKLGLHESVIFLGQRRDVNNVLASFDVFLLASRWEGFSNAILEAMASSLPVVATDVGGNPEAIISEKTGFIVPPNDPEAISKRIMDLLNNPEMMRKMGEAGRKRVTEHFSIATMVLKYENIYLSLSK
jgi:glycosyltransferase involved in cell wall biosynthesis